MSETAMTIVLAGVIALIAVIIIVGVGVYVLIRVLPWAMRSMVKAAKAGMDEFESITEEKPKDKPR